MPADYSVTRLQKALCHSTAGLMSVAVRCPAHDLPGILSQESGVPDWLGLFANASFGVEAIVAEHKAANDDYSYIMAEALADRLAEAFAEKLHQIMRKQVRRHH